MAEKSETLVTKDEKLAEAKELFGRGSRNFCMKQYSDAADDLSACCTIYSELYGPASDECGTPYLLYAKSLIALGKDENNLIVPGEGEEAEDDDDDEDEEEGEGEEGEGEAEGEGSGEKKEKSADDKEETADQKKEETEAKSTENGASKKDEAEAAGSSSKMETEPQPGPSTSNGAAQEEENEEEEEKCEGNLEVAWEILELAVQIFEGHGEKSLENLSECYSELASISLENSNFAIAINDYKKSLAVYDKTGKTDRRVAAEINYKIGLCHLMQNEYEDSIKALKEACNEMDKVIELESAKEQTDETKATIKELEETKQEIMEKVAEVEETKKTSIEEVKRELSKIIVKGETSNGFDGAGPSSASTSSATNGTSSLSSSSTTASKPTDISHLIKRKKPDTVTTEVEGSPAKKTAVEADKSTE